MTAPAVDGSRNPWVGLRPFLSSESELFFGRDRETQILLNLVSTLQTLVVYAPSGTGKSSVINAGLAPTIDADPLHAMFFANETHLPVTEQVRTYIHDQAIAAPSETPLDEMLELFAERTERRLVVVVDQFEERVNAAMRDEDLFDAAARMVHRNTDAGCILISIREDYLGSLEPLMRRVPGLLNGSYRVPPLTRRDLEEAIYGPLRAVGAGAGPETKLVRQVLDDLGAQSTHRQEPGEQRFEPGYFQIVWSRLWEATGERGKRGMSLAEYRALGGATAILKDFTSSILGALEPAEAEMFWAICRYLVLPTGAKTALTIDDLTRLLRDSDYLNVAGRYGGGSKPWLSRLGHDELADLIRKVFDDLTSSSAPLFQRVIRSDREEFELLHDLLGKILLEWREEYAAAARAEAKALAAAVDAEARELFVQRRGAIPDQEQAIDALLKARPELREESIEEILGRAPSDTDRQVMEHQLAFVSPHMRKASGVLRQELKGELAALVGELDTASEARAREIGHDLAVRLIAARVAARDMYATPTWMTQTTQKLFETAIFHPAESVRRVYQRLTPVVLEHAGFWPLPARPLIVLPQVAIAGGVSAAGFALAYVLFANVVSHSHVAYAVVAVAHAAALLALVNFFVLIDSDASGWKGLTTLLVPGMSVFEHGLTRSDDPIWRQLLRVAVTWPLPAVVVVGVAYGAAATANALAWSPTLLFTLGVLYSAIIVAVASAGAHDL